MNKMEKTRLQLLNFIEWEMRHSIVEFAKVKDILHSYDLVELSIWSMKNKIITEKKYFHYIHLSVLYKYENAYKELAK